MSKKVVSFTLPPKQSSQAAEEDAFSAREGSDKWVRAPPETSSPEVVTANPLMIDLTAERTWFELLQLIAIFPYLATSSWMQNAARVWLGPAKPR